MKAGPELQTPVAFFIFNRPDTTRRVFDEIRRAKPPKLLVVADGPRINRSDDVEKCAATRAIVDQVDWDCEVLTNYSEGNLGCRRRISSGLDWVFETVEEAIILEDDCLPHPSFFHFCDDLLKHYRCDERVMAISGDNFQFGRKRTNYSYYFSRYPHVWGWATWRRAWQHYDIEMKLWPLIKSGNWLRDIVMDGRAEVYWISVLQSVFDGKVDTWDFQWAFATWIQDGLCILPSVNLISNIGFASEGTHTTSSGQFASIPVEAIGFPLRHPPFVIRDIQADAFTQRSHFETSTFARAKRKIKKTIGAVYRNANTGVRR